MGYRLIPSYLLVCYLVVSLSWFPLSSAAALKGRSSTRQSRILAARAPALPSGWTVKGCYTDATSQRTLSSYSSSTSSNTPQSCLTTCQNNGFTFGGVEFGKECYCGNSMTVSSSPSTGQSASASDCSTTCSGDSSQSCGGGNRIMIYSYTAPSSSGSWSTVGCYVDTSNRVLPAYQTVLSSTNTPAACQATCSQRSYAYAGVEYGQECWCANAVASGAQLASSASECTANACSGDAGQKCGGSWRINVFKYVPGGGSSSSTSTTSTATRTTSATSTSTVTSTRPPSTSSTATSTSTSATTSSSQPAPSSVGKVVVAHVIVGNVYSYNVSQWKSEIALAQSGGIDGFAMNVGIDSWEPARVADAYSAAKALGTNFKLFISLDTTSLPCNSASDAILYQQYVRNYTNHPNQLYYKGKQVVSTFAGENCRFGQGDINSAWNYAVKAGAVGSSPVAFIPAFFSDPNSFGGTTVMDGVMNWNGGWPMGNSDISIQSDATWRNGIGNRYFMAAVTPAFFTHYSYKNWIYRSDNWLYNTRWEQLLQNTASVDIIQIVSWNDYGESHYIGPIGADQPSGTTWTSSAFDHTAWITMTSYYAAWFKSGSAPAITKDKVYIWSRPHSRDANVNDPIGKPNTWQATDDNLYAAVFSTSTYNLQLTIGSSSKAFSITPGVNKVSIPLSPGSPVATLTNSSGATVLRFAPSNFVYATSPPDGRYNFNYLIASSP